jgi:multidrug efflux pump subunit AcrA (membrane-fusion protein)
MQLTESPEGKSSLQTQLEEAEKRAQEAEVSVQGAQATLARTLLEAARVEAVVTARIKAQSEAELEALRAELVALKRAAPEGTVSPDSEGAASAPSAGEPGTARMADPAPESCSYRRITLKEWDLPLEDEAAAEAETDVEAVPAPFWSVSAPFASMPFRVALFAVAVVGAVASYALTATLMSKPDAPSIAAGMAGLASGLGQADSRSESVVTGDWAASASGGNWLLYMPVERQSLVQYLAGRAWTKIQLAEKQ